MNFATTLALRLDGTLGRTRALLKDVYPGGLLVVPRSTPVDDPGLVMVRLRSVLRDERLLAVADRLYMVHVEHPEVRTLANDDFVKVWGAYGFLLMVLFETLTAAANSLADADVLPAAELLAGSQPFRLLASVRPGSSKHIAAVMGHRVNPKVSAEIHRLLGVPA
ncbi:hypothetical protein [Piscinibacter defluvii]|uniref:hypothetical protein n=1 Tax=Piscinibacter defluvii TaxID=1796922 RepID=UPI000FDDDF0A|nr:hypothetical protein [Piscinibacter defluvii]